MDYLHFTFYWTNKHFDGDLEIIETTIYVNSWSFEICMNSMIGVYESRIISNITSTIYISPPKERSSQASAEENKRQRVEECIIHCSDETGDLVSLKDLESWKTLLNAAVIRSHEGILSIAKTLKEGEIPRISYHRKCRSIFTLKRDLKKLSQSVIQVEEPAALFRG